jgi:hypothetical protein
MSKPKLVPYMDDINVVLDFLKKRRIPYELLNVQERDGRISAAGILFKGTR